MKIAYIGLMENLPSISKEVFKDINIVHVFDSSDNIIEVVSKVSPSKKIQDSLIQMVEFLLDKDVKIFFKNKYKRKEESLSDSKKLDIYFGEDVSYIGYDKVVGG